MLGVPSSFLSDDDVGYSYYYPSHHHSPFHHDRGRYYQRQQQQQQQRRRRAALEHDCYLEQQRLHDQQKKYVLQLSELQRRREEQERQYQLAYEHALSRRQAEIAAAQEHEARRRRRHQQEHQQQYREDMDPATQGGNFFGDAQEAPVYQLLRGPDGRIYHVPMRSADTNDAANKHWKEQQLWHQQKQQSQGQGPGRAQEDRSSISTGALVEDEKDEGSFPKSPSETQEKEPKNDNENTAGKWKQPPYGKEATMARMARRRTTSSGSATNTNLQRVTTVLVEDVLTDEETDGVDDYQSSWKNRRPSPGEWMEPVEAFHG